MARKRPVFNCLFCEHCCYFSEEHEMPVVFPWEKRELEKIAAEIGVKLHFKPLQAFIDGNGVCAITLYRWEIRGFCPFFDKASKRCSIHDDKPLACRMYPLLVEMPSGNLMASGKCDWIKQQGPRFIRQLSTKPETIPEVFPAEFEAAKKAFIEFTTINSFIERHGLQPINVNKLNNCNGIFDIDDYIARFD